MFPCELDDEGDPLPSFYERQRAAYLDPVPHRHKFSVKELKKMAGPDGNKNAPAFTIHLEEDGTERRYTYLECRRFYCRQYEKIAKRTKAFKKLRTLIEGGTSVQIIGYDGHACARSRQAIFKQYLDPARPFGHEMVLFALLVLDRREYPWLREVKMDGEHPQRCGHGSVCEDPTEGKCCFCRSLTKTLWTRMREPPCEDCKEPYCGHRRNDCFSCRGEKCDHTGCVVWYCDAECCLCQHFNSLDECEHCQATDLVE